MSDADFGARTFGIGTVRGLRVWDVDELGRLEAVSAHRFWTPGENAATCGVWSSSRGIDKHHNMLGCTCGFYAFYNGQNNLRRPDRVAGVIEGYGQTVVGTKGFRAEKARILAIHVPAYGRWRPPLYRWFMRRRSANVVFGLSYISIMSLLFSVVCGILLATSGQWNFAIFFWVLDALSAYLVFVAITLNLRTFGGPRSVSKLERVVQNYPDVRVFSSYRAMLRAYPIEEVAVPTPASDPDFWKQE